MKDMKQLPEWLQELYEINPRIARKAELDFNAMADEINSLKNSQASNPLESSFNALIHSLGAK